MSADTTRIVKWLQLSDLHLLESTVQNLQKDFLQKLENISFVVITGDLKDYHDNYDQTIDFLKKLSEKLCLEEGSLFFVPGNHDITEFEGREACIEEIDISTWNNWDSFLPYRDKLTNAYTEFLKMSDSICEEGFYTKKDMLCCVKEWQGKLNLLHINTSLLCDKNSDKKQIVDTFGLSKIETNGLPVIAVMHHDFYALHEGHQKLLKGIMVKLNVRVCLSGHIHRLSERKIGLNDGRQVPNFVCGKSMGQASDHGSDSSYIIYEWDPSRGTVVAKPYKWCGDRFEPSYELNTNQEVKDQIHGRTFALADKPPPSAAEIRPFISFPKGRGIAIQRYQSYRQSLYYSEEDLGRYMDGVLEKRILIVKGGQGSGKTMLSLYLAERLLLEDMVNLVLYLPTTNDMLVSDMDRIRSKLHVHKILWVIDNLHQTEGMEANLINYISDSDYYICLTRNMNQLPSEIDESLYSVQKREVTQEVFRRCLMLRPGYKDIPIKSANTVFHLCGADLLLMEYVSRIYTDWSEIDDVNEANILKKVYDTYFRDPDGNDLLSFTEAGDVLKMLFLLMLEIPVPKSFQNNAYTHILQRFMVNNAEHEMEMEHASLAALLFACVCADFELDDYKKYLQALQWAVKMTLEVAAPAKRCTRINVLIDRVIHYVPVICTTYYPEQWEQLAIDPAVVDVIGQCQRVISCTNWKVLLNSEGRGRVYLPLFSQLADAGTLADAMIQNQDYQFQFIHSVLDEEGISRLEGQLLAEYDKLNEVFMKAYDEKFLMDFIKSLSEEASYTWINRISKEQLTNLLTRSDSYGYQFGLAFASLPPQTGEVLEQKPDYYQLADSLTMSSFLSILSGVRSDTIVQILMDILVKRCDDIIDHTISQKVAIGTFAWCLQRMKDKSLETLCVFERIVGTKRYIKLIEASGTIPGIADVVRCSSQEMKMEFIKVLEEKPEIVDKLLRHTIDIGVSIGTFDLKLWGIKKESPEVLQMFEQMVGAKGYIHMIEAVGTFPILVRFLEQSSQEMRIELIKELDVKPKIVNMLLRRTIDTVASIGTFALNLRNIKKESPEVLQMFEQIVGAKGYLKMIEAVGTLPILVNFLEHSSQEMRMELIKELDVKPKIVNMLLRRTIVSGVSIGTFALRLREIKKESPEVLQMFEQMVGAKGYLKMVEAVGTIPILAKFLQISNKEMRIKLVQELEEKPEIVDLLLRRTIDTGESTGTFALRLRDIKKESPEVLQMFEQAVGAKGYLSMVEETGTLPVLLNILRYSSQKMQIELVKELEKCQEKVGMLLKHTIDIGASIGTFDLSLWGIKKGSPEVLQRFEQVVGVKGYLKMIGAAGTVPILARILECSSQEMQIKLVKELKESQGLFDTLIQHTVDADASMGTFNMSLQRFGKESPEVLHMFEHIVGAKGYLKMIGATGTVPILASIIECSSQEMQIKLVKELKENREMVDTLIQHTVDADASMGTFNMSLQRIGKKSQEVLHMFEQVVGVKGYLKMIEATGTVPILARITECSSQEMQMKLVKELKENREMADALIQHTVDADASMGSFYISLRGIRKESPKVLHLFEQLIGVNGYMLLFSQGKVTLLNLLKIMAYSSMADQLLDALLNHSSVLECAHERTEMNAAFLNGFSEVMYHARHPVQNHAFFRLLRESINGQRWIEYFSGGATWDEYIAIMHYIGLKKVKEIEKLILADEGTLLHQIYQNEELRTSTTRPIPETALRNARQWLKTNAAALYEQMEAVEKGYCSI